MNGSELEHWNKSNELFEMVMIFNKMNILQSYGAPWLGGNPSSLINDVKIFQNENNSQSHKSRRHKLHMSKFHSDLNLLNLC